MIASFLIVFDLGVTNKDEDRLLLGKCTARCVPPPPPPLLALLNMCTCIRAGSVAVFNLLVFYASPLSNLVAVVKTRDASSIYAPLSVISVINGSLWTIYGLFIQDYFVMGPNAFGAVTGIRLQALPANSCARVCSGR